MIKEKGIPKVTYNGIDLGYTIGQEIPGYRINKFFSIDGIDNAKEYTLKTEEILLLISYCLHIHNKDFEEKFNIYLEELLDKMNIGIEELFSWAKQNDLSIRYRD